MNVTARLKSILTKVTATAVIFSSLGPAPFAALPAHAAISSFTVSAIAGSAQNITQSSQPTAVLGINVVGTAGETLDQVNVSIAPSAGFALTDLAAISTAGASSGVALYRDDGATQGAFDSTDTALTLGVNSATDGSGRFSKLTPTSPRSTSDNSTTLVAGDIMFANITAGGATSTPGYTWHMVTTGATGVNSTDLRFDGAGTQPTYGSTQTSILTPAATSTPFVVAGTNAINPVGSYNAPAVGDIVFYQTGTTAGAWGIVTNATLTSGTFAIDGSALAAGTYRISRIAGQYGSFTMPGAGGPITPPGSGYTSPTAGDIVLYQNGIQLANWGVVTAYNAGTGQFTINNVQLFPNAAYRISKVTAYSPSTSTLTSSTFTGADIVNFGDLVFGMPITNPATASYNWHSATGDTTAGAANLRLDSNTTAAPTFGIVFMMDPQAEIVPANDTGNNTGADYFVVVRTSTTAVNTHAFTVGLPTAYLATFGSTQTSNTVSPTYTISASTAQQTQSAGATTTASDMTNGVLRLKQSSGFRAAARVQFGSAENNKTLTSITVSFTNVSGTSTWTQGSATSSNLLNLATTGGGISLWKDLGGVGFQGTGIDQEITLAASPLYGASNSFAITPATPPTITSDDVYIVALKSATSGISNNDSFILNMGTGAIATSGGATPSPTIGAFATSAIRMDTSLPTITSVSDMPNFPTKLRVQFSEPVQKVNAGGALTATDFTYTNDAANGSGLSISSVIHNPNQDFAEIVMNGNLAPGDFDGTPSTLAAGSSRIEDMAGNAVGTTARNLASPLTITTGAIPTTFVGATFTAATATSTLVTFAASGGAGGYQFVPNTQADTDTLTALGLTLTANNGRLAGTIAANSAGQRNVTIRVTDSGAVTATKLFTINVTSTQGGGTIGITQISPQAGTQGATNLSLTITGTNTHFTSASSTVAFAFPPGDTGTNGISMGSVTATSATSLTVPVTIAAGATLGARDVTVTTGPEVVTMPRGFSVIQTAGAGLNLVFPTDGATGVQLPQPVFNFNPSTNTSITNYRIVVSTTQDFATALWDYAFLKPDAQATNGSHCTTTSCNVNYGEGRFLAVTPPTALTSNTTYYWKVETYQDPTPTTLFASSDITDLNRREVTPVRSFTTSASVNDVQPPQIEHRPIMQARTNTALTLFARVLDNIASASSTPALSTTLYACNGASCALPATTITTNASDTDGVVAGSPVLYGNGYYSYTIPSQIIGSGTSTPVRYYISATDGANTNNFYAPGGSNPFQFTPSDAITSGGATITGTVKDMTGACPAALQGAFLFAEGTGFNTRTASTTCAFTLGATNNGLAPGFPYDLITAMNGYSVQRRDAVRTGSTSVAIQIGQGAVGGFGGDTTRPRVLRSMPGDNMQNQPGKDYNMKILVVFDKPMSQTAVLTSGNMVVNEIAVQTGTATNITTSKGSWAYYQTYTMPFGGTESNVAVWSLTSSAGTGTIASSGTTVTGTGTSFSTQAAVGDVIAVSINGINETRIITAIASNTSLTIDLAFPSNLSAGSSFTFGKVFGDNKSIAVKITPSVVDTSGNAIQGNLTDGNYSFMFTTGSSTSFTGFNSTTGAFAGGGTFGEGNFTAPHVTRTSPGMGSPSVPRNTKIMVNFDRAMADDGGGYTLLSTLKLFEVSSAGVETDVTSAALNTATLTSDKMGATLTLKTTYPSGCSGAECGIFKASTRYRLQVLGSAKAANGMTMRAPDQATQVAFMSDYTTAATSDTSAPSVIGSAPNNNDTNVPSMLGSISVSFNKDMDSSTITTSTMTLTAGSTAVTGTVDYRPMERTAYFMPSRVLTPSTEYTLTLSASILGINSTAIAATTRTFTTGVADTSAPTITMMTVDDTNIAITFSKPMNAAPATDSTNYVTSVLRAANYTLKYGSAGFDAATGGTTLTLPSTAQITYDSKSNTAMIRDFRSSVTTTDQIRNLQLYTSLANATDIGGNAISTAGTAPDTANTARATVQSSATTQGQLGPMTITNDMMKSVGDFKPPAFSGATFGFARQTEARPFNMMTGTTTIFGMHMSISKQIPSGGSIVLTFPQGFNVSGAKQDINSPKRRDMNTGSSTVTFKCLTNVTGFSGAKSCAGTANTDDTGSAQGGLADDGVVVNGQTVTLYLNGATNSEGHDELDFDIAGIVNSNVAKDFNTSGYTVSMATKNGTAVLETLSSVPFFIQSPGTSVYTLTGTVTATSNNQNGTISVFLDSPMTGPLEATTTDFAGGETATYSFANLQPGDYGLRTEPSVAIGTGEFLGKFPERVNINANTVRNFTLVNATSAGTGTAVTISVDGPANEPIDIFANGPAGFRVIQKTLNTTAGAEDFSIRLSNGDWFVGVGPQMPKGQMGGPPPSPSYLPPRPVPVQISGATCVIEGTTTCTKAFTLTSSTKQIKGVVKDLSSKIIAGADVFAYSPAGAGMGNFTQTDTTGTFTLNVTEGVFNVGTAIPGMPPSKEVPVEVTSNATTYLKIDGASTAITPAAAATSFVLKLAKPDFTISGKVTDGTNVINGASVYAYKQNAPGNVFAPTNTSGNYSLFVSAGTWKVGAFLPKYGNLTEQTVTITTANATDINFAPTGTGTFYAVSGTVTVGGTAREGAHVRIKSGTYNNDTRTDSLGAYTFNVPQGNGYTIDGFVPGAGEIAPLTAFNVSADTPNKDLTVSALRTVTVTLSSSVSRAFVELRSTTTGATTRKEIRNSTSGTLTVPDGTYMTNVDLQGAPIPFTAVAATSGATTFANTTGVMTVADGNEGLTVTVPTLRTLTVTVQDGSSVALADAWVELMNPTSGEHFGNKTGTNGQVTLNAADGTYFINAMKPGYYRTPTSLTVAANAAPTLTLSSATKTISGQVLIGSAGAPNAFVRAEKQGGGFAGAMTDANGLYTLSVTEGIWRVFAKTDGYAEVQLPSSVDVTTASESGKDITLSTTVATSAPKSKPMTPSTGGTIEDASTGIKVDIPANALGSSSSAGNMQVKKTTNFTETDTARPVAAVEITATDSAGTPIKTLNESVTVELTYTKTEVAAVASSSDTSINTKTEVDKMDIGFWDESVSNWSTLPTTTTYTDSAGAVVTSPAEDLSNVTNIKLSALTDHFSLFAPVVPTDPSAPSTPTGLAATAASTTQINLSWTAVSGATGYDIYRSTTSSGSFSRLGSEPTVSSGSTVTYSDTSLTAATAYFYKISSLNNNGESTASSAVSATTTSGATSSSTSSSSSSGGGGGGTAIVGTVSSSTAATTTTTTTTTTTAAAPAAAAKAAAAKAAAEKAPAAAAKAAAAKAAAEKAPDFSSLGSLSRSLALGSKGADVKTLQEVLKAEGFYKGEITGVVDAATLEAVKKLQVDRKLAKPGQRGYGTVGPATRTAVNAALKELKEEAKAPAPAAAAPKAEAPKAAAPAQPSVDREAEYKQVTSFKESLMAKYTAAEGELKAAPAAKPATEAAKTAEQLVNKITSVLLPNSVKAVLRDVLTNLPEPAKKVGAGQLAAALNSTRKANNNVTPEDPATLGNFIQNAILVSVGRFHLDQFDNPKAEKQAANILSKLYKRTLDPAKRAADAVAIEIATYGLQPARDTKKEAACVPTIKKVYGAELKEGSAEYWDVVRACAYSGATR